MTFNISYEDMYIAYEGCRKRKKNTMGAKKFETYALYNIIKLTDEINEGKYKLMPSTCFVITYPTAREVFCASFRDRIVQHFIFNELNPIIEKKLINDTASCRVGKGTDYAISRVKRFVRTATNNYRDNAYYLKIDLSGFFMAIDRDALLNQVTKLIDNDYKGKYKDVLKYLCEIVIKTDVTINAHRICPIERWDVLPARKTLFGNTYGLAIGNITSQMFANFYLNDIDHFAKSWHRFYVRYVDDIIIIDKSKEKLFKTLDLMSSLLPCYHQKINVKKTKIQEIKYGIKFLGIKIKPYYACMAKSRINRLYYSSSLVKTAPQMVASASSRKGMFQRYKGYKLSKRWYYSLPPKIKDKMKMYANYHFAIPHKKEQIKLLKIGD